MDKILKIVLVLLLFYGRASTIAAQTFYTQLPMYFEISNAEEWTSELMKFEEPIDGFRITVFTTNNNSLYNGYPFVNIAEVDITDADDNEISYTATTNSLAENDGNGLAGLYDNNVGDNGHYHSAYSNNAAISPTENVYIEFKFDKPQDSFKYRMVRRNNKRNFPIHFTFSSLGEKGKIPFNPTNPAEPDNGYEEPVKYYKVLLESQPVSIAYVTSGGEYTSGTQKWINTYSTDSRYIFSHWTLNDEFYSDSRGTYYTVDTIDAHFVAHYVFEPTSPVEPDPIPDVVVSPLYLTSNIEKACTFNQVSGNEFEADTWVDVNVTITKGYNFLGWYSGATLVNSNTQFSYQMPAEAVSLIAKVERIVFNPDNPFEPSGSQENVQTNPVGDVNKDGVVNILDIIAVVNKSLSNSNENLTLYDLNSDGIVNILDIIKTVNISME